MARVKAKNKAKFKFTYQFGLVILFLVTILALSIWFLVPSQHQRMRSYFSNQIPEDHIVRRISPTNFKSRSQNVAEGEFMIVFFGTPENVGVLNQIHTVASQVLELNLSDIGTIYYLNAQFAVDLLEEVDEDDVEVDNSEYLDEYSYEFGFDVSFVPTVMIFTNEGKVSSSDEEFRDRNDELKESWGLTIMLMFRDVIELIENNA